MPSDCVPVPTIDPVDGKPRTVFLRSAKMQEVARRGMGAARELAHSVREVLGSPTAIFRGVREEGESEWLCYSGIPSQAFDYKTGQGGKAWEGEVLLVYVNDDLIIYHWRWEKEDSRSPGLPIDHATRFNERAL